MVLEGWEGECLGREGMDTLRRMVVVSDGERAEGKKMDEEILCVCGFDCLDTAEARCILGSAGARTGRKGRSRVL